ncbi:MAG: penicillin-binding protein activator [Pseudomonadota bacterium]
MFKKHANIYIGLLAAFLIFSCAQQAQLKSTRGAKSDKTLTSSDTNYLHAAIEQYKQGDKDQALETLDKMETKTPAAYWLEGNIFADLGKRKESVDSFVKAMQGLTDEALKSKVSISILSQIDKMSIDDLEDIEGRYSEQGWSSYILFELGEKYSQQGNNRKAISRFNELISSYPQNEYKTLAEGYLNRLNNLEKVEPYNVGVILPLSGKNSAFGMKSLMGIQLATGVFGTNDPKVPIKLSVMDSQSNPEVARTAVDRLIEEDHVAAIIGPLSGDTAEVVAKQCNAAGIPNITLSQKEDMDGMGKYVFRVAMTNKDQARRLVSYAMDKLSIRRFAILYPDDNYGQELSKNFWDEVLKRGGEVSAVEYYDTKQADFSAQVKKLLGVYYVNARLKEYNDIKEQKEADAENNNSKKKRAIEVTLPPVQTFDALFIADEAKVAAQIAPYLPFYDAKGILLMGPNTWNSPQLVSRGGEHVEGAIFVDSFTPNPPTEYEKDFVGKFKTTFNSVPGVLEFQAYNAGKVIADTLKTTSSDRNAIRDEISRQGFSAEGNFNKELFVFEVNKGKIILKN